MKLLKNMRELRKKRGISLEKLGEMLGKSKQTMSGIELGKIGLDYDLSIQIANILGGTPDEIFLPDRSNLILPNSLKQKLSNPKPAA